LQPAQLVAAHVEQADPPTRVVPELVRLRAEKLDITRLVLQAPHSVQSGRSLRLERGAIISKCPPQSAH